jgi:predicted transcriptional regulator
LTVSLSVSEIRAKLRDEDVENSFSFPSLVVRFKGLQAKIEIERVAKNIITGIENRADNLSHVSTKFKSKRAGVREIQNLNGWNELSEDQRTRFVERVKNAFKDEDNNKTLKTIIKEIVNEVREEIKAVRKNKPDQGKIKQLKQECSRSLEAIQG